MNKTNTSKNKHNRGQSVRARLKAPSAPSGIDHERKLAAERLEDVRSVQASDEGSLMVSRNMERMAARLRHLANLVERDNVTSILEARELLEEYRQKMPQALQAQLEAAYEFLPIGSLQTQTKL